MTFRDRLYNFIPYLILIIGIISSLVLWKYFNEVNVEREKEHLKTLADETVNVIENRLKTYEDAHHAGGAMHHASGRIDRESWRTWVQATRLMKIYPGINGLGIAVPVGKEDSLQFLEQTRKEIPEFKISGMGRTPSAGDRFIIKYIEPVEKNYQAIGFDMGSEPKRRAAMERAMLSGKTAIAGKVKLVQDKKKQAGFLMYVPIYQTINVPDSFSRRDKFELWVYSPFITADFIKGLINKELKNTARYISFKVYDGDKPDTSCLLYSHLHPTKNSSKDPEVRSTFNLYGMTWTIIAKPNERLKKLYITNQPTIILIIGIMLTFICSILVYSLANTRRRAVEMAGTMTVELQDLNVQLEKKVEDRTRQHKELNIFYESLIQAMHEGLLVLDPTFRIVKANKRFFQLFAADEHVEGLALTELSNVEWSPVLNDVEASFKMNEMFEKEYLFDMPGAGRRYLSITSIPLRQVIAPDQRVLLVISDVTDRKENEQRKNDFIGFVTHELRTPLSNLKAYAQLSDRFFKQGKPDESFKLNKKLLAFIDTLNNLVSELHDVTKVQSGKLQIIKKELKYDDFINEVIEAASYTYSDYEFILEGRSGVVVLADKYRLNQVLTNYISNAVKYSPENKKIIIRVGLVDGHVQTSVKDFGTGIPEAQKMRVFERLFRVQKHHKTEGLGLGLYLSREIIKAHGGKVWVESEENKGSEFYYCIPYDKAES